MHIECSSLEQRQLDRMPDYFQNLQFLYLRDDFPLGNYDFNFVTKFKNLKLLKLYFNIEKETTRFILHNCKHPNFELGFGWMQNIWISSQRNKNGRFELSQNHQRSNNSNYPGNKKTEFDCIENAVDYCYQNDLFNTPFQ